MITVTPVYLDEVGTENLLYSFIKYPIRQLEMMQLRYCCKFDYIGLNLVKLNKINRNSTEGRPKNGQIQLK